MEKRASRSLLFGRGGVSSQSNNLLQHVPRPPCILRPQRGVIVSVLSGPTKYILCRHTEPQGARREWRWPSQMVGLTTELP